MQKSKTKSPYNTLIIIFFIISIIYTSLQINVPPTSKYNKNTNQITGIITKCEKYEDYTKIFVKAKENIILNYYKPYSCIIGNKIKANGIIEKPNKNTVFNLFNYQNYLHSQKITFQMKVNNIKIINKNQNLPFKIKNNIINHINKYKSKNYLNTFILGNNKEIEKTTIESYQTNGISHLLAISGMHITIISTILLFILNKLSKRKIINYLIVILILSFYMFLTNFSPSVTRAVSLFIILTIKKTLNLKIKTTYILLIICSLFLFNNPYIIYNIGFLLSFIITFFLILFKEKINSKNTYISKIFTTSYIAFLAGIPILITNFFEINLLSPFINIIFVPLISIIIYPLSLLTLIIKPLDNILFNLTKAMENLSILISNISILKITLSTITLPYIIIYYLIIYYVIKNKKIILLIIIILFHHNINYLNDKILITTIDVGQGDSILISKNNNKQNILIDTGGKINFKNKYNSLAKSKTIPYLKSIGINKLNYLILTHGDYDHMGEAINLVNNFKVEKVIFNCGEYNDLEKELINVLDKKKIKYYSCIKELNIDKNKLYFLQTKEYDNENDNSNVIYTELDGYKFMFMGDAGVTTEKEIINKYDLQDIDILKVGHHGSRTSSSKDFINEINPKYSIISVGKNNRYGHPNKEVLDNLKDSNMYRTDQNGSIMFKIKNNKLEIETCSP